MCTDGRLGKQTVVTQWCCGGKKSTQLYSHYVQYGHEEEGNLMPVRDGLETIRNKLAELEEHLLLIWLAMRSESISRRIAYHSKSLTLMRQV